MSTLRKLREAVSGPTHTPEDVSRVGHACWQEGDALEKQLDYYTTHSPSYVETVRGTVTMHFAFERCDALLAEANAILAAEPDVHYVMHAQRIPLVDARDYLAGKLATVEEFRPR